MRTTLTKAWKPPTILSALAVLMLTGCGRVERPATPPRVSLHEAAARGDVQAIREHIAAGSNLDERDPVGGSTPLMTAAVFGHTESAKELIEAGADLDATNREGSTALHTAAFLCRREIVQLLLERGAEQGVRNGAGATALESVEAPFDSVEGVYDLLQATLGPLGLRLDYQRIKATRPEIAALLR